MKGKNKKGKKAQLKIQEMAFVLVAIFLLFLIIGFIFLRLQTGKWEKSVQEVRERRTISLLNKIASMPELSCGSALLSKQSGCIDKRKLEYMSKPEIRNIYGKTWKHIIKVEVREVYSREQGAINPEQDEQNPGNSYKLYEEQGFEDMDYNAYSHIINLCSYKQSSYKCDIGKITVFMKPVEND